MAGEPSLLARCAGSGLTAIGVAARVVKVQARFPAISGVAVTEGSERAHETKVQLSIRGARVTLLVRAVTIFATRGKSVHVNQAFGFEARNARAAGCDCGQSQRERTWQAIVGQARWRNFRRPCICCLRRNPLRLDF